ncbi:unnamed protein product [Thlaspi arvense]|uniref:Uncharacterized protein n=1 Tax=Thlaspi arvense TaxID=13288 RepID=A0AAU9RF40_THLAR|nr:unnamed protein product [Thlaspi arvense]
MREKEKDPELQKGDDKFCKSAWSSNPREAIDYKFTLWHKGLSLESVDIFSSLHNRRMILLSHLIKEWVKNAVNRFHVQDFSKALYSRFFVEVL